MNEPPSPSGNATPDDPVEARIVAWVLGEASAFEAAELERLCEEKPELLVFRRRMRELHGLLTEAEAAEPDDTWKLTAEKRKALEEIFGQQEKSTAAAEEAARDHRVSRTGRRALLAIAACVTVTFFVIRLVPTGYEAEATIEIRPRSFNLELSGVGERVETLTPQFFGTEFEKIKSHNSLGKVVDQLGLTTRWGMDRESAIRRIRENIRTDNIRGTDLVSIRVREKTGQDAQDITRAVTRAYADYRRGIDDRNAEKALAELNKAVRDQEAKVEERRKVLATIVRTKGIIYKGQDSFYGESGVSEDQGARGALQTYNQLTQEKMQAEAQINGLLKYDEDQLRVYAAGLDVPDNLVRNLYPHYLEAGRQLETMKHKGLDDSSPDVLAMKGQMAGMKKQMDEGVVDLRATLLAQLDMTNDRLKNVELLKDDTREDAIKRGLDTQDYADAKRDFEADQELLQQMRLKQIDRTIRDKMTNDSIVIHEEPHAVERKVDFLAGVKALIAGNEERPPEVAGKKASAAPPVVALAPASPKPEEAFKVELEQKLGTLANNGKDGEVRYKLESEDKTRTRAADMQAEARQQQLAKNRPPADAPAPPPAEPQGMPEFAESSEMKPLPRVGQEMSIAGNASGFGGGDSFSARQPRPRIVPAQSAADETADSFADASAGDAFAGKVQNSYDAIPPAMAAAGRSELSSEDSSQYLSKSSDLAVPANGAPAPGRLPGIEKLMKRIQPGELADTASSSSPESLLPSKVRAGANLGESVVGEQSPTSPDGEFDMVKSFGNTEAPESAIAFKGGRIATYTGFRLSGAENGISDGAWPTAHDADQYVLGGVEHRIPNGNRFTDDSIEPFTPVPPPATALAEHHEEKVEQIRSSLYTAEGKFNLGKYDDAEKSYKDVLRIDPYNKAARRGIEQVETARSEYYRARYDHTRAELLGQLDAAWELSDPAAEAKSDSQVARKDAELSLREEDKDLLVKKASELEKKIAGAADSDSKKADFRDWEAINRELIRRAKLEGEQQKIDVIEETSAAENPYSTFSLNISDASFQVARAAIEKGERPEPASIKPEQFYNAVDYGDPAPATGEPVAATIEQSAHPVTPGRSLVRVAVRTGASGRSAAQPLRLTLLVDQSGSMVREDRRAAMDRALSQLSGLLTKADVVNVIGFSRTPHLLAEGMTGDQSNKLPSLVNQTASEGGTNLEEALKLGGQLATRHQLAGAQNRIVLFTDGAANLGDADPTRLAEEVKTLRQKGIAFDIAGIAADDLNDRLLSELARNGNGRYYVVDDQKGVDFARQLAGAFRPAAENVKIQVIFNPRRVARYKLIGFEKDRLKTEDFRNDAVDAAELAAEETGTAIYQVEEVAEGAGEIGELSVRFRDTASGEMVERSWTLPHATTATAFDRATPSMQLAGLSLLAAEKLRGGPLADAIDFKQLSGTIGSVKQYYGASSRAGEMLRLIDAIK